jgi:hypothetical protein
MFNPTNYCVPFQLYFYEWPQFFTQPVFTLPENGVVQSNQSNQNTHKVGG